MVDVRVRDFFKFPPISCEVHAEFYLVFCSAPLEFEAFGETNADGPDLERSPRGPRLAYTI